ARLLRERAAAAELVSLLPCAEGGEAGARVAARVRALLPIDVCVLGFGEDGHTASLFPGGDRLAEALAADAEPVLGISAPGAAEPRITLAAPVLRGARRVCLLFTGPAKRAVLARAMEAGPIEEMPVRVVLGRPGALHTYWSP